MNRAYVALSIKAVDDDARLIEGWASTASVDRAGDIVVPKGAVYKLPMPFLLDHDHRQVVGEVDRAEVTDKGIKFWAHIKKVSEPGEVKDLCDKAWSLVKNGLRKSVSIGFSALAYDVLPNGGLKFTEWEWLELSAVGVPANAEAQITSIKSFEQGQRYQTLALSDEFDTNAPAATGQVERSAKPTPAPRGNPTKPVNLRPKEATTMKTIQEQIAALESKRAANVARMDEIMTKSVEEGRSTDEAEQEEFDGLSQEVEQIDGDLKRFRALEKNKVADAKAIGGVKSIEEGRQARSPIIVKEPKLEPGVQFARFARCMILGKKQSVNPLDIAKQLYAERDPHVIEMVQKANISAVNSSTDASLFGNEAGVADYVTFLRNQTIIGRFGQGGIPGLRRVPFYFPVVTQATGGTAYWVAEGAAKPMTKPTWSRTELTPLTVAGLAAITLQALRFSSPSADLALRDDLTAAVVEAMDLAFIDPANSGTSGAKPASITNGISGTVASSGLDAEAVRTDARGAMRVFVNAKNPLSSGVWIMSGSNALGLATMVNALGQAEFPSMTVNGGTFMGLPVIVSEAAGDTVTLVNAGDIWVADEGGVMVDMSDSASLQMVDNPSGTSTGSDPVEATMVSMFQTNSVAVRVETHVNWARRRPSGVATITDALWGTEASGS